MLFQPVTTHAARLRSDWHAFLEAVAALPHPGLDSTWHAGVVVCFGSYVRWEVPLEASTGSFEAAQAQFACKCPSAACRTKPCTVSRHRHRKAPDLVTTDTLVHHCKLVRHQAATGIPRKFKLKPAGFASCHLMAAESQAQSRQIR